MPQSSDDARAFLDALHADKPLRVWSLIVTVFGDVVMQRGAVVSPPPVWTGHLLSLLVSLDVDAGLVRTSLSRLVASGVLLRGKQGRNTFYRLSETSRSEFADAAGRIYGRQVLEPTGDLHLALTDRVSDRARAREALEAQGFRFLSATTALLPQHAREELLLDVPDLMLARVKAEGNFAAAARALWPIQSLQERYQDFLDQFGKPMSSLSPKTAVIARIVAVHRMRRLILQDPVLPLQALPPDWAGGKARMLLARLLVEWHEASEHWLAEAGLRGVE